MRYIYLPMRTLAALLLFAAVPLSAQPAFFGEAFPLTNVREAIAPAYDGRLLSNGREPFLFWSTQDGVRVSRVTEGRAHSSRFLFEAFGESGFDAAWTGSHFVVVGAQFRYGAPWSLVGRFVSARGEPVGETFPIADGIAPRVAFHRTGGLLVYRHSPSGILRSLFLGADGRPVESSSRTLSEETARFAVATNGRSFAALVQTGTSTRVLLFDAQGALQSESTLEPSEGDVALASNGDRYLALTTHSREIRARVIEPDGAVHPPIVLSAESWCSSPAAVWTRGGWVVTFTESAAKWMLHTARLDAGATAIVSREQREGARGSLATIGPRLLAAWLTQDQYRGDPIHGSAMFVSGVAATLAPVEQELVEAASSADATLVVWQETGGKRQTLRAGVRTRDGRWNERELQSGGRHWFALAASDGREFLVVTQTNNGSLATFLDREARVVREVPLQLWNPHQVVWNGKTYSLFDSEHHSTFSASGALSEASEVPGFGMSPAFYASNGNAWYQLVEYYTFLTPPGVPPTDLFGRLLGEDLQPFDETLWSLAARDSIESHGITWDGAQWTIAWTAHDRVMAAHVTSATAGPALRTIADETASEIRVAPFGGGTAILWERYFTAPDYAPGEHRFAFLGRDGTVTAPITLAANTLSSNVRLTAPGDGGLGYIATADHRLMMRVGSATPLPDAPGAPKARLQDATLEWDAPSQTVTGYRVEVRENDGPWVELESWFTPDQRAATITTRPGARTAFRVRAFNDAGPGEYSKVVTGRRGK